MVGGHYLAEAEHANNQWMGWIGMIKGVLDTSAGGGGCIKLKRKSTSSIIGRGLENWENMADKAEHKFGQIYTPEIKTCVEE